MVVMDAAETNCHQRGDGGGGVCTRRTRSGAVVETLTRLHSTTPTPLPLLSMVAKLRIANLSGAEGGEVGQNNSRASRGLMQHR